MPPRDPTKVQADFPQLVGDLIGQLRLVGTVGLLDFDPTIQPSFIVGSRGLTVVTTAIEFLQAEIFDGSIANWAANAIVLDTGQLAAGTFDIKFWMSVGQSAGGATLGTLEHRDAANAVALQQWHIANIDGAANDIEGTFATNVALNERFRIRAQVAATGRMGGTLAIKRRVVP